MFIGTIKAVENKTLDIVLFGQVYFLYIIQKFGVTEIFFFCVTEIDTFIHQGNIKLIKSDSKDIYNVAHKSCSFELSTHQRILRN